MISRAALAGIFGVATSSLACYATGNTGGDEHTGTRLGRATGAVEGRKDIADSVAARMFGRCFLAGWG